jgi:hypothetical protein
MDRRLSLYEDLLASHDSAYVTLVLPALPFADPSEQEHHDLEILDAVADEHRKIRLITRQVELLPWTDRASWQQALRAHPFSRDRYDVSTVKTLVFDPNKDAPQKYLDAGYITSPSTIVEDLRTYASPSALEEYQRAIRRFEGYLRLQIRPGRLADIQKLRHRLSVVARGPWRV